MMLFCQLLKHFPIISKNLSSLRENLLWTDVTFLQKKAKTVSSTATYSQSFKESDPPETSMEVTAEPDDSLIALPTGRFVISWKP